MQRKQLNQLNQQIEERKQYLSLIEEQIEKVTELAADNIRSLQGEVDSLEDERARLLKANYNLEQTLRENQYIVSQIT